MVSTKAASQSAKRKKTEDMPDSPPKRVTRARAKATEDTGPKSKVTKITTASAKVSAETKRLAEPAKPAKRKTRADDEAVDPITEAIPDEEIKRSVKIRGRQKKATDDAKEGLPSSDVPAPSKGRQSKTIVSEQTNLEAPKPRGRPRKMATATVEIAKKAETQKPKNENARGRATLPIKATRDPAAKSSIVRKKVKFQEEPKEGKENIPLKANALEKPVVKATGLKARPVRKPATIKATTRGKKMQAKGTNDDEAKAAEALPLSPKKIKQVAMSSSIGSEDELGYEKTPLRALSRSPVKSPMRGLEDGVSKFEFSKMKVPASPIKSISSSVLASPARRPPASPFKDAFKDSPKRVNLGDTMSLPIMNNSRSPAKASLLQSPARRPPVSPVKLMATSSPRKAGIAMPLHDPATASKQAKPIRVPLFSPSKTISSPLRAARSPDRPFKVHKIDEPEQVAKINFESVKPPVASKVEVNDLVKDTVAVSTPSVTPEKPVEDAQDINSQAFIPSETTQDTIFHTDDTVPQNPIEQSSTKDDVVRSTTPPDLPDPFVAPAFSFATPRLRFTQEDSDSEDELASIQKSYVPVPVGKQGIPSERSGSFVLDGDIQWTPIPNGNRKPYAMTPLAMQLSSWLASSPEKQTALNGQQNRGIFSPVGPTLLSKPVPAMDYSLAETPPKSSFFEDEMAVRERDDQDSSPRLAGNQEIYDMVEASQDSQASEEYGDENAMPVDPHLVAMQPEVNEATATCTPAKVFFQQPREIHTVSKVPLRPADEDSPLQVPRKRSRSLAGPLRSVNSIETLGLGRFGPVPSDSHDVNELNNIQPTDFAYQSHVTPIKFSSDLPQTPAWSNFGTPARTVRKGVAPNVLEGAVVFVDVYTTEGADASGIFLDLLTQMGARCVKQWAWNPRSRTGSGDDTDTSPDSTLPGNKVGITHVVYKDGGKRTLEKVREAKGVVLCVGVGWVLDCERENKWLDETEYAVDTSLIPRGGHNRRKSMEPRMLSNLNGSLIPAETTPKPTASISPTKEFLTFDTPTSRRDTFIIQRPSAPQTPVAASSTFDSENDESGWGSPTTPYYLSRGAQLVQQTCPPKPTGEVLFPLSGRIEDQPNEGVRQRLLAARRKSLQWVPKVASPLGRAAFLVAYFVEASSFTREEALIYARKLRVDGQSLFLATEKDLKEIYGVQGRGLYLTIQNSKYGRLSSRIFGLLPHVLGSLSPPSRLFWPEPVITTAPPNLHDSASERAPPSMQSYTLDLPIVPKTTSLQVASGPNGPKFESGGLRKRATGTDREYLFGGTA